MHQIHFWLLHCLLQMPCGLHHAYHWYEDKRSSRHYQLTFYTFLFLYIYQRSTFSLMEQLVRNLHVLIVDVFNTFTVQGIENIYNLAICMSTNGNTTAHMYND